MNTIAHLKVRTNRSQQRLNFEALSKIGLLVFCLSSFGCQTASLPVIQKSSLDSQYRLKRLSVKQYNSDSASVRFYQQILRQSLFSHCKYFPSDSAYSQIVSKRCGSFASLFKTYDRFIREPDAANLGLKLTFTEYGAQFIDLPESCDVY